MGAGFGYSCLDDSPDADLDESQIVDVLRDWGWSGSRERACEQFSRRLQRPVKTDFRLASKAPIPSRASSVVRLAA